MEIINEHRKVTTKEITQISFPDLSTIEYSTCLIAKGVECYDVNDQYIRCKDCAFELNNYKKLRRSERGLPDV